MKVNKNGFLHLIAFFLFFIANFLALLIISNLDLFDFFSTIHKVSNVFYFAFVFVLFFAIITLFTHLKELKRNIGLENKENVSRVEGIEGHISVILKEVKDINLNVKNYLINNISLKEKLMNVVKSVSYINDYEFNAVYNSTMERVVNKIADYYTSLNSKNKQIDYFVISDIVKDLKNIFAENKEFRIDTNYIIELSKNILEDYARKKTANPNSDKKIFILEYFKLLTDNIYKSFIDNSIKNNDTGQKGKTINTSIKGTSNNALSDVKANNININFGNSKNL